MKKHVQIIAEAGVNHNGSLDTAKQMVVAAKECGADIVKFQTANVDALVSRYARMAEYQKKNTGIEESQKDMLRRLMLSYDDFDMLAEYCKETGIQFLSSPFDTDSIHFLDRLQEIWKIPSGEITNYPYLVEIARTGKPVILSTGMAEMQEIYAAMDVLKQNGAGAVTLMHCTTEYPAPMEDVRLNVLHTLKDKFHCPVGYSDHTQGIEVSIAAVAIGAEVIEKHFTLDRGLSGPDHKASLEPAEFKSLAAAIRNIETAKGSAEKIPVLSERKNREAARKSIVAARDIRAGEVFCEDNLAVKRPGCGISPMKWREVLGKAAQRDFKEDELIEL